MVLTILSTTLPVVYPVLSGLILLFAIVAAFQGGTLLSILLVLLSLAVASGGRKLAKRYQSSWIGRIILFGIQFGRNPDPALLERFDQFADSIIEKLETGDEVLLAGHSSGAVFAPIVASMVASKRPDLVSDPTRFCLLTLGGILPCVAGMPEARHVRSALQIVQDSKLAWLDFTSPRDPACCALVNPLEFVRLPGTGPKLLNAQFHKIFTAERVKAGSKAPLDGHFLYLQAPDTPDPHGDLFDWPATLVDYRPVWLRYQNRDSQDTYYRG